MSETALERVLKRDRAVIIAALIALTVLSWTYLLWLSAHMSKAAMPSMPDMPGMVMAPEIKLWTASDFALTFVMWAVMMIGMMTPSAAPMILLYAHVGRQASAQGKPFASTFWFASGYLLAWGAFSLAATAAQFVLSQTALITPMLAATNTVFGGLVLIMAGIYQWTPLKYACLSQCQSPLVFIQRHGGFQRGALASLRLGGSHGLYCIGCCWALMALLFVGGVMNILWIAALGILVLLEKILPRAWSMPRAMGLVFVAAGLIFLYRTIM